MHPPPSRVIWDMLDGPMPRGLLGVGSGDAQLIDGWWTLFLGGYSTSFRNRLYVATAPGDTDPATANWRIRVDGRGRAQALLRDPPRSAWDGGGLHTPCYVPAADGHPPRIYYAGRRGRRHVGAGAGTRSACWSVSGARGPDSIVRFSRDPGRVAACSSLSSCTMTDATCSGTSRPRTRSRPGSSPTTSCGRP